MGNKQRTCPSVLQGELTDSRSKHAHYNVPVLGDHFLSSVCNHSKDSKVSRILPGFQDVGFSDAADYCVCRLMGIGPLKELLVGILSAAQIRVENPTLLTSKLQSSRIMEIVP